MKKRKISDLIEPKQSDGSGKMISAPILNALLIGFLIGIIVYSVAVNSVGFLTLISLYLAYKLINKPKATRNKATDEGSKKEKLK